MAAFTPQKNPFENSEDPDKEAERIRLLDVDGDVFLDYNGIRSQDFLMINTPTVRDPHWSAETTCSRCP